MIRYSTKKPGGDGVISILMRLWWIFINNYHSYRWLLAQSVASSRNALPRNEKRKGETAVITGGSKGIGAAVVKRLLQCDMHVIIGCRDRAATNSLIRVIRRRGVTTGTAEAIPLDLSSVNSIKEFAFKVMKKDVRITVLINNAAIKCETYGINSEGIEQHFQVNYLSHVLLTYMLLPKLHCSADCEKYGRIINVSSLEHYGGYPDLTDPQMMKFYSPEKAYMDTKLMMTAWNEFLDSKLQKIGAFVRAFSVHPGFVKTDMWSRAGWIDKLGIVNRLLFERRRSAADTICYAAISNTLEDASSSNANFLLNNQLCDPHSLCKDEKFQNRLWKMTCKLLNMEENGLAPVSELEDSDNEEEEVEDDDHGGVTELADLDSQEEEDSGFVKAQQQQPMDLDFLEEFHSCGYEFVAEGFYPPEFKEPPRKEEPKEVKPKPKSSFITSWKHSFKINLNLKIWQYLALPEYPEALKGKGGGNKPYYEYLINSLFSQWNLNKSCLRYLEGISILLLRRLDRLNSHFKLIQAFANND